MRTGCATDLRHNEGVSKTTIVVSSDWHPDVVTMGIPRFSEVEAAVHQTVAHAIKIKADAYLFLGDLVDPDSGGATSNAQAMSIEVAFLLAEHGIQSVWIAGNHDVHEDGSGATTLTPLAAIAALGKSNNGRGLIHVVERPSCVYLNKEVAILCLPFTPSSHGVDLAAACRDLWPEDRRVIVASHLTVPGVMPGEETSEMPRGREIAYPFAETARAAIRVQGHYHRRQTFDPKDGGPPIQIPGSLARLTFGEEDHVPSFFVLEI